MKWNWRRETVAEFSSHGNGYVDHFTLSERLSKHKKGSGNHSVKRLTEQKETIVWKG